MKEDKFVGTEFETGKGVITVRNKVINSNKYICTCSVCSLLNYKSFGSIQATKKDLLKGRIPCLCSKNSHKFDTYTLWHIAKERVEERGWLFIGFNGEFCGVKTKVTMQNPLDMTIASDVSVNNLPKIVGFPTTRYTRAAKKQTKTVTSFQEDLDTYSKGQIVFSEGGKVYSTCKVCTEKGLPSTFEIKPFHTLRKILPCLCGKPKLNREDKEVLVRGFCKKENLQFLGFSDNKVSMLKTKVKYLCKNGHLNSTTNISTFLRGTGCKQCYLDSKSWNYYKHRLEEEDFIYFIEFKYEGVYRYKCGKAFNIKSRLRGLERVEGVTDLKLLDSLSGTHKVIFYQEIELHKKLKKFEFYTPAVCKSEIYHYVSDVRAIFMKFKNQYTKD